MILSKIGTANRKINWLRAGLGTKGALALSTNVHASIQGAAKLDQKLLDLFFYSNELRAFFFFFLLFFFAFFEMFLLLRFHEVFKT